MWSAWDTLGWEPKIGTAAVALGLQSMFCGFPTASVAAFDETKAEVVVGPSGASPIASSTSAGSSWTTTTTA